MSILISEIVFKLHRFYNDFFFWTFCTQRESVSGEKRGYDSASKLKRSDPYSIYFYVCQNIENMIKFHGN